MRNAGKPLLTASLMLSVVAPIFGLSTLCHGAEEIFGEPLHATWRQSWSSAGDNVDDAVLRILALPANASIELINASANTVGGGESQMLLLRYESDGVLAWVKSDNSIRYALSADMLVAPDGGVFIATIGVPISALANAESMRLSVRKIDGNSGAFLWEWHRDLALGIDAQALGGVRIARSGDALYVACSDHDDYLITRFTSEGALDLEVRWGSEPLLAANRRDQTHAQNRVDVPTALRVTADAGFIVTGYENGAESNNAAYRTLRFNASGTLLFSDREIGTHGSLFTGAWLELDQEGNSYVLGGPESSCGDTSFILYKISASGARIWTHPDPGDPCVRRSPIGLTLRADASSIIVSSGAGKFNVTRIRNDGTAQWARQWGSTDGALAATAVAFAVNYQGRTRVVGSYGSNLTTMAIAEWDDLGMLCAYGTGMDREGVAIQALGRDWLLAAQSQSSPGRLRDAVLLRYPEVACGGSFFANSFE